MEKEGRKTIVIILLIIIVIGIELRGLLKNAF